jgi:dynein heavy chain, axonemal
VFTVDRFHDEITFGTINENVDETIIMLFKCIYIPRIFEEFRDNFKVRQNLFNDTHSFMSQLTDFNSKIGSMVILYVPNEGHDLAVEEAVLDKMLVKRLENVVSFWISQIQLCINDMKYMNPTSLPCPADEYDFWVYKC